jgi:hypothetical protein
MTIQTHPQTGQLSQPEPGLNLSPRMVRKGVISVGPFVQRVAAERLHVGKQLLTADGWQTIRGIVVFADADQVSVFTDERDDLYTDGWPFHFGDQVEMRLTPTTEQDYQRKLRDRRELRAARRRAMEAAGCPSWCIEHQADDEQSRPRNHASETTTLDAVDLETGAPIRLELRLERRDDRETGEIERFGVLRLSAVTMDLELTPENMRLLASHLMSLADRAMLHR